MEIKKLLSLFHKWQTKEVGRGISSIIIFSDGSGSIVDCSDKTLFEFKETGTLIDFLKE